MNIKKYIGTKKSEKNAEGWVFKYIYIYIDIYRMMVWSTFYIEYCGNIVYVWYVDSLFLV
jgi:hypothetical protein